MTVSFATLPAEQKAKFEPRAELDHYPTALQDCRRALGLTCYRFGGAIQILDPGAGTGPWGTAARELWPAACIHGVEIRETETPAAYDRWFRGSFIPVPVPPEPKRKAYRDDAAYLKALAKFETILWASRQPVYPASGTLFDLVIGNPPYEYAEEFIRHSMGALRPKGACVFLLRLAFLEGQDRAENFWPGSGLREVHVLAKRPSFFPEGHPKAGNTDATAYAIYLLQKGWRGGCSLYHLLPETPPAVTTVHPRLFEEVA